jgi:hypothetical protein
VGEGHQLLSLISGIAKHVALVTSTCGGEGGGGEEGACQDRSTPGVTDSLPNLNMMLSY